MKLINARILAMRAAAEELWDWFKIPSGEERVSQGSSPRIIDDPEIKLISPSLRFVLSILRSHALREDYNPSDIKELKDALNQPVDVEACSYARSATRIKAVHFPHIKLKCPDSRQIAQELLDYLSLFEKGQDIRQYTPIVACCSCQRLFFRKKLAKGNNNFCSTRCRSKWWNAELQKQNPQYFADKARVNRRIIRERKAKRQSRSQKT